MMARMLTEPDEFSSRDVGIFFGFAGLLPLHVGN
jgi:hypothetical protein